MGHGRVCKWHEMPVFRKFGLFCASKIGLQAFIMDPSVHC